MNKKKKLCQRIQELEAEIKALKKMAFFDPLTKIANRQLFNQTLVSEWSRSCRNNEPLSLIFCDVDHFKLYNDTYGHIKGDQCLQIIAETLKENAFRSTDLVARYGGEEFAIILPDTVMSGAKIVAKRMCTAIHQQQIVHKQSKTAKWVTLSLGVVSINPVIKDDWKQFLVVADTALYEAKARGRNQIVCIQLGADRTGKNEQVSSPKPRTQYFDLNKNLDIFDPSILSKSLVFN